MLLTDLPPIPTVTEDLPAVSFYTDEDGGYWVPVDVERDQRRAWLRCEATSGVALIPEDPPRLVSNLSDCELGHACREGWTCDAHPGCPDTPCPPAEPTDVWAFVNVDERDEYRAGLFHEWSVADGR
jgi:hypothetical protein